MKIEKWSVIAPYTSWRIGGRVEFLLKPRNLDDLLEWTLKYKHYPLMMLGLGSNVLFPDDDLSIAVIDSRSFLQDFIREDHNSWIVGAGVSCAKLARDASRSGYKDAAFFCGIPGTIGGALYMNAGAFSGETWNYVSWVDMLIDGEVCRLTKDKFSISYRKVIPPKQGFYLRAKLSFSDASDVNQQHLIAELLEKRSRTQPIGQASCGSVFKNPYPFYAGHLIESSGLKGYKIGGAEISNKHANFIVNVDNAKASDVLILRDYIVNKVYQDHKVLLESEFLIVNSDGTN